MRSGLVKVALMTCAGIAVLAACSNGVDNTVPTQLVTVSGSGQFGDQGQPLDSVLKVQVLNISDAAVAGVTVSWSVKSGGGLLTSTEAVTDANGFARASFQLGQTEGQQEVQARALNLLGSPVTFTETARPLGPGGGGGGTAP